MLFIENDIICQFDFDLDINDYLGIIYLPENKDWEDMTSTPIAYKKRIAQLIAADFSRRQPVKNSFRVIESKIIFQQIENETILNYVKIVQIIGGVLITLGLLLELTGTSFMGFYLRKNDWILYEMTGEIIVFFGGVLLLNKQIAKFLS